MKDEIPGGFRSFLADEMKAFLQYKRALKRKYYNEEKTLRLLDRYLVEQRVLGLEDLTPEVLQTFLSSRPRKQPRSYNHLLGVIGRLCDWLVRQEKLRVSPLHAQPRRVTTQRIPFLFDTRQARRLLQISAQLPDYPCALDRGELYPTIFALLYGLGLRVGEVSRLCYKDVDFDRQLLVIRQTKFSKSRLVPFGPRMAERLTDYCQIREQRYSHFRADQPLFSFRRNQTQPIHPATISQVFHRLIPKLDIELSQGVSPPRLHDLRHSFAVATLLRWYHTGFDMSQRLIYLSTFMGHVDPSSTAVYLTITEELLHEANKRFERFVTPLLQEVGP